MIRERESNTKQEQNPKNRKEHRQGGHARKWKAGKMERLRNIDKEKRKRI